MVKQRDGVEHLHNKGQRVRKLREIRLVLELEVKHLIPKYKGSNIGGLRHFHILLNSDKGG